MPKRIQMSRQRPWRADHPDAVIVSRPSKWGNPVAWGPLMEDQPRAMARQIAVELFVDGRLMGDFDYPSDDEIRRELAGRDLACWCPIDQPCHGDVLLELANPADRPGEVR